MNKELPLNESSSQSQKEFIDILSQLKRSEKEKVESKEKSYNSHDQIQRLTSKRFDNMFEVLDISEESLDWEIRKQYKKLLALVFPDKNTDNRASDAFQLVEKAYRSIMDPENREEFNRVFKEAKSRVDLRRQTINRERTVKGLKPLPEEKIDSEIKQEIKNLKIEVEREKKNKEEIELSRRKREKEEWEKQNLIEDLNKELEKEWESSRESRIRDWIKFQNQLKYSTKQFAFQLKPPGYSKTEERKKVDERVNYRSLTEN
mmetsp:Transcript_3512/g.3536  ORF Transcript_3512/g.3536 Transcript_3512/m.3536 type:complete len:261 (+) Transcript_3512:3-785(+)